MDKKKKKHQGLNGGITDGELAQIEEMWLDKVHRTVHDLQETAWKAGFTIDSIRLPQENFLFEAEHCFRGFGWRLLKIHTHFGDVRVIFEEENGSLSAPA